MPDEAVTRGDLEALRSELKDEIHSVRVALKDELAAMRLEVAQFRTDMSERFGTVQAEFGAIRAELADVRKELAVLQVDIRKDLSAIERRMEHLGADMQRWQLSTTRQLWTMVSVVSGAVIVGILKLVFFP